MRMMILLSIIDCLNENMCLNLEELKKRSIMELNVRDFEIPILSSSTKIKKHDTETRLVEGSYFTYML